MSEKFTAGDSFPDIKVQNAKQQLIELGKPREGFGWKLVVVYRGRHCPLCSRYLQQLESLKQQFYELGIDIVAVSGDSYQQLEEHLSRLSIDFPIAYGLSIGQMQQLTLYISHPRSEKETDHPFPEPAIFVVNSEGRVQLLDFSNGPFARPELKALLAGLAFIKDPANDYPIRGTYS